MFASFVAYDVTDTDINYILVSFEAIALAF